MTIGIGVAGCRGLLLAASALLLSCSPEPTLELHEADIAGLQRLLDDGEVTSAAIVSAYLEEIERIDSNGPTLRAIIETNPDALSIARRLDQERRESGSRGPLHGIPVVLKANIDTGDRMQTTAGSMALAGNIAADDAFLVERLRAAGAVILAKANLSEWANFRSNRSSSGWSSLGGQTRNPYDPARNPCGSSSGSAVAVAANLTVLAVGTETDGSIVCPAGINGIVGVKPSLGLVSRDGIIPIAHSQDTAGPMARTVRDAAIMLGVLAAADDTDPATAGRPAGNIDYAASLSPDGLRGRRVGILRNYYGAGSSPDVDAVFENFVTVIEAAGATAVDPVELDFDGVWAAENEVLFYEFKANLNRYLQQLSGAPRTLETIIRFNASHAEATMPWFGQDLLEEAQSRGPLSEPEYQAALQESGARARLLIDELLASQDLDAIAAPTNGPAWLTDLVNGDSFSLSSSSYAAVSGYPSVTVPAGMIHGLPIGVSLFGAPFSERQLLAMAYAFEQRQPARVAPGDL